MMKKSLIALTLILAMQAALPAYASSPSDAAYYQREAIYYKNRAESCQRDAEYYLRQAQSADSDAAYYLRQKNYSRARDYFRRAADYMDSYRDKLQQSREAADRSKDYYRRAANAL